MFSKGKSKSSKTATSAPPSIVSADLTITGNLESKGEIQVDGVVEGDVSCARLSVGSGGHVKGTVTVETALIRGRVDGLIKAKKILITRSARVVADIIHETLTIEPGAYLVGHCRHAEAAVLNADGKVDNKIKLAVAETAKK